MPARTELIDDSVAGTTGLPSGVVTFLFTDIEGSTRLARALGPTYRQVLADHRRLMRDCLRTDGGAELLTEGDSFFAVFADAGAALHACVRAQQALAAHPWPRAGARPKVRMGLHTGYAEARDGEYVSAEVHRAARVAAAAAGDQVLCSTATARAAGEYLRTGEVRLADLGAHRLRGFDDRTGIHQVLAGGLPRDFPPPRTQDGRSDNLPLPVSGFVGRGPERVELAVLASEHRLVTVWGVGGVGKTRLATEVARDIASRYPAGAWFCDLAGADTPEEVQRLIAGALGIRPGYGQSPVAALLEYLADRRCLLLVDSCERQRPAVATLLARLLAGCPGLTVLATSRAPLGVPGELVWRLAPLRTDEADSDAPALLVSRVGGGTDRRRTDLARLARLLGGLPLAIELAVPWLRSLPPVLVVERLTTTAGALLVGAGAAGTLLPGAGSGSAARPADGPLPERHTSLAANLDWSYRLLGPDAAGLLRRLAVWPGRASLPAVEWLTSGWLDRAGTCAVVAELVDAALLEADMTDTTVSYRVLDPVRWAARQLAERADESAAVLARYRRWSPSEQGSTQLPGVPE